MEELSRGGWMDALYRGGYIKLRGMDGSIK